MTGASDSSRHLLVPCSEIGRHKSIVPGVFSERAVSLLVPAEEDQARTGQPEADGMPEVEDQDPAAPCALAMFVHHAKWFAETIVRGSEASRVD